jgi:hypothetical protein
VALGGGGFSGSTPRDAKKPMMQTMNNPMIPRTSRTSRKVNALRRGVRKRLTAEICGSMRK